MREKYKQKKKEYDAKRYQKRMMEKNKETIITKKIMKKRNHVLAFD